MRDHRNLEAWKEAKEVAREALRAVRDHWKPQGAALFGQLQKSSLSVYLNVAEGYALKGPAFANHLRIAYGSAVETGEILELAIEEGLLPQASTQHTLERCFRCQRLLLGLIKYCRRVP